MTTLYNLTKALTASWGADTAFNKNDWTSSNPARGQCVVSSLVVQDYIGGELVGYSVEGPTIQETHFVNLLPDGSIVDTTKSQYTSAVTMKLKDVTLDGFASIREKRLSDNDTRRRYELLKSRVQSHLKELNETL